MKISHLHIDQFRHLEDLKFDFTYPDDFHDESKRGKPLDKICIIGQSATGKTGILELIANQFKNFIIEILNLKKDFLSNTLINFLEKENIFINFRTVNNNVLTINNNTKFENEFIKSFFDEKSNLKSNNIYLNSNINSNKNLDLFNRHPNDIYESHSDKFNDKDLGSFLNQIELNESIPLNLILFLIKDFVVYQKKFTQIMSELINKGLIADRDKFESEYKKWERDNPKMLKDLAEKLNPLIHKLGLEIDMVNTEFPIPFRNIKTDEIISIDKLSTGTKGLLLSILPIYKLNTKDSIILIDEPERSLYPDIQMEIMEHYQNLAPDAQFIVATHSPFIAASFEPEERFILYFDENGKVAVRRGTSPIGDDPNDILYNDFGVNYYNEKYIKNFKKYNDLLNNAQNEANKEKKKEFMLKASKLGNQYNFNEKDSERLK